MTKRFFWNGIKVHLWRDFLRVQGVWYWFNCLLWKRNCPKIAPYPNCKKERISDFFQNILLIGVERNRKQRNPVDSITSWIVSGTHLCIRFNWSFHCDQLFEWIFFFLSGRKISMSGFSALPYVCSLPLPPQLSRQVLCGAAQNHAAVEGFWRPVDWIWPNRCK